MNKEDSRIPICHGEPMQPMLRRKENGVMVVTYHCMFHNCSEKIDVVEEKVESGITSRSLRVGPFKKEG